MTILEVHNLKKVYTTRFGGNQVQALRNIQFSVEEGEYVAIMGESGSGKTTLLNILAALDRPTEGEVLLNGKNLVTVREKEIAAFRREHLGFVFQDFHLLDNFSLKDNIFLPLVLSNVPYKQMNEWLYPIAQKLGIVDILEKYPYEVSGGQKQRAAVARVERGGRLVHEKHIRLHGKNDRDSSHALFSTGHFVVVAQLQMLHVQTGKRFVRLPLGLCAAQTVVHRPKEHIVQHGRHEHLVVRVLQHIAELPAHLREALPRDRDAVHGDAARIGKQAERGLHERGLARAVGADQGDDLAVGYLKADAAQRLDAAVGHVQVFNLQHRLPPPNMPR